MTPIPSPLGPKPVPALLILSLLLPSSPGWGAERRMDESLLLQTRVSGSNLAKDGHWADALRVEEKSYRFAQEQYGPLHPSLVPILRDMGTLRWNLGRYEDAERDLKWALALAEKAGDPSTGTPADLNEILASFYLDLDRLDEALAAAQRSLALRRSNGSGPIPLAKTLELMSWIKRAQGDLSKAGSYLDQAQRAASTAKGQDPSLALALLGDQAGLALAQKDPGLAETFLSQRSDRAKKDFSGRAESAETMEDLGHYYLAQGRTEKGRSLLEAARGIEQGLSGTLADPPSLAAGRRLALVQEGLGNLAESTAVWDKVLAADLQNLGKDHPQVAKDLMQRSRTLSAAGKASSAGKDLREALRILRAALPEGHPLTLKTERMLGKDK